MNNWCICWFFVHPLIAELNPICHLLALLGGATVVVVSRLRVNYLQQDNWLRNSHVTRHNTPIHNILSTAPQFSISQKALGTLPEDGNVMPKHVGATIHN